jgi:hypothetical protein
VYRTFYGVLHPLVYVALVQDASEAFENSVQALGGELLEQLAHLLHEVNGYLYTVISRLCDGKIESRKSGFKVEKCEESSKRNEKYKM